MTQHLWYVRTAEGVRGPFPQGQVARDVELGRLGPHDEVSLDARHWTTVADSGRFTAALELRTLAGQAQTADAVADPWRQERARARLRWDDERDEAAEGSTAVTDHRRREPVSIEHLRRDHRRTEALTLQAAQWRPTYRHAAIALLLIGTLALAVWYGHDRLGGVLALRLAGAPDCAAPPAPAVDWRGCDKRGLNLAGRVLRNARLQGARLEGADLSGADLGYADLRAVNLRHARLQGAHLAGVDLAGADLTGADLSGARLYHANLRGAHLTGVRWAQTRLGRAVWVDGRVCAAEAVGRCD
ncbi:MAG: pentapeptide repeat-containing protein [Thiobacillaceae bacterium]|nr:pentapeptide repeat-containing protein [Thiobacillaceae bacterium]